MKKLLEFSSEAARKRWQSQLQGDRLGYVIFAAPALSFSPVHRVLQDPELGPVILLGDTVFEVDVDGEVYPTREEAVIVYYNRGKDHAAKLLDGRTATIRVNGLHPDTLADAERVHAELNSHRTAARQRLIFFVVDRDGNRTPMPDLYWFEENMIRTLDERSPAGHRVEWEVIDE